MRKGNDVLIAYKKAGILSLFEIQHAFFGWKVVSRRVTAPGQLRELVTVMVVFILGSSNNLGRCEFRFKV